MIISSRCEMKRTARLIRFASCSSFYQMRRLKARHRVPFGLALTDFQVVPWSCGQRFASDHQSRGGNRTGDSASRQYWGHLLHGSVNRIPYTRVCLFDSFGDQCHGQWICLWGPCLVELGCVKSADAWLICGAHGLDWNDRPGRTRGELHETSGYDMN
jgi:hypothetical protein